MLCAICVKNAARDELLFPPPRADEVDEHPKPSRKGEGRFEVGGSGPVDAAVADGFPSPSIC